MNNNEIFVSMVQGVAQLIRPWKVALIVSNVLWLAVIISLILR
jgi:hypothetical protein